jgi:hypothetical protein
MKIRVKRHKPATDQQIAQTVTALDGQRMPPDSAVPDHEWEWVEVPDPPIENEATAETGWEKALRTYKAAQAQTDAAELERLRDLPICRLQFPDGSVPGNTEEALAGWHRIAQEASRQLKIAANLMATQRESIEQMQQEIKLHRDKANGDYWAWAGDEFDHPESLVCPVLIPAATLRKLLADAVPRCYACGAPNDALGVCTRTGCCNNT